MPEVSSTVQLPDKAYNGELLDTQLRAALGSGVAGYRVAKGKYFALLTTDAPADAAATAVSIANAHNANVPTEAQQIEAARVITRTQVVNYIRTQLTNPTPNVATIKTQVQAYIDTSPKLQTALTNVASLYGYNTGTNAGYLQAALQMLSFML